MTRRRAFFLGATCVATWPTASRGQAAGGIQRIAYLGTSTSSAHLETAFTGALRGLGYVAGKNLSLEVRYATDPARVPAAVKELMAIKPIVLVCATDILARDALAAGAAVPVVFALGFDPVGIGLVKSLRSPGGRATGFSVLNWELNAKRMSLLKEALPNLKTVAVVYRDGDSAKAALDLTERAAHELGIGVIRAPIAGADDFGAAFKRMSDGSAKAVINVPDVLFFKWREQLAALALQHRIAAMFGASEYVEAGMLLSYGTDFRALFVRAAALADRVVKGADPAGIPVEQANTFDLVVNRRTARTLGIDLPRSLLLQATRVIE
jgi:putative tryptophan/tyrosine transport system substrate-binding protein